MIKRSILIRIVTILVILFVGIVFPTTVLAEPTEKQEVAPYIKIHPNNKEGLNRLLKKKTAATRRFANKSFYDSRKIF